MFDTYIISFKHPTTNVRISGNKSRMEHNRGTFLKTAQGSDDLLTCRLQIEQIAGTVCHPAYSQCTSSFLWRA